MLQQISVLVCLFGISVGLDVSPLQTWEVSPATLTSATGDAFTAYNGDSSYPDCIFFFGGISCSDCNTIFCYNITSNELLSDGFGTLDSSLSSSRNTRCDKNAFLTADDLLYWIDRNGDVYYYDLNDDDATSEVQKTSFDVSWPAMVKHPDDLEFYVFEGANSDEFWVYDLTDNEIYQGNSLNVARYRAGIVVNEYYDSPYIYVLGGKTNYIERLNINDNDARDNEWELLQLLMQSGIDDQYSYSGSDYFASAIESYANFIYLIGGWDGSSAIDDIISLDVANWDINWAGVFPTGVCALPAQLAKDRVYTFGSFISSGNYLDEIYISNSFDEVAQASSCSNSNSDSSENNPTTRYPGHYQIETKLKKEMFASIQTMIENHHNNNNSHNGDYYIVLKVFVVFLAITGLYTWIKMILTKLYKINNKNNKNGNNNNNSNRFQYQSINF